MSRAKGPPPTPRSQALAQFTHYRGENPSPKPPCYEKVCKNPCLAAALFVAETMQRHEDATPRGVRYPHSLRTWFDFGTKPLQRMIPEDMGIPAWSTWPCLGGRSLHKWSGGHLLEESVRRGMPGVTFRPGGLPVSGSDQLRGAVRTVHAGECVARSDVPSDHALVVSLDGLMPCEILESMAAAIATPSSCVRTSVGSSARLLHRNSSTILSASLTTL